MITTRMREQLAEAFRREGLPESQHWNSCYVRSQFAWHRCCPACWGGTGALLGLWWLCQRCRSTAPRQLHVLLPFPSNICFIFFQRSTKGAVVILGSRPTAEEKDPRSATGTVWSLSASLPLSWRDRKQLPAKRVASGLLRNQSVFVSQWGDGSKIFSLCAEVVT